MDSKVEPSDVDLPRVKVFISDTKNDWTETGRGRLSVIQMDGSNTLSLLVLPDDDGPPILECDFTETMPISRQNLHVFAWRQSEMYETALSFIDPAACSVVWETIQVFQNHSQSNALLNESTEDSIENIVPRHCPASRLLTYNVQDDFEFDDGSFCQRDFNDLILPAVELKNLAAISKWFSGLYIPPAQQKILLEFLCNENNLDHLFQLFHMCDDLQDMDGLRCIYVIIYGALQLNSKTLYDMLFIDDNHQMDVIGVLEYDSNVANGINDHYSHRRFIRENASFNDIACISDSLSLYLIHKTFRIQYIQDVVLPASFIFEENHLGGLNEYLNTCKSQIVYQMLKNPEMLQTLCTQIKLDIQNDKLTYIMKFFKELAIFISSQTSNDKQELYQVLSNAGLLSTIHHILSNYEEYSVLKQLAIDIFCLFVDNSVNTVWRFCIGQSTSEKLNENDNIQCENGEDDPESLLEAVISELINTSDAESSLGLQITHSIKTLLDQGNNIMGVILTQEVNPEFVRLFIDSCLPLLFAPILANTVNLEELKDDKRTAQLQYVLIDLVIFMLEGHTKEMIKYLIDREFLNRILSIISTKHQFLKLAVLRLFRKIVGLTEDSFDNFIVQTQLLELVLDAFIINNRSNMFEAAVLELFDYILKEDREILIDHFARNLYEKVSDNSNLFARRIKERHLYFLQRANTITSPLHIPLGISESEDVNEQIYFNNETAELTPLIFKDIENSEEFTAPVRNITEEDVYEGFVRSSIKLTPPTIKFNLKSNITSEETQSINSSLVSYPVDSDEECDDN